MSLNSYSHTGSEYNFYNREFDESLLIPGTDEYKKARRRRQNRESASRVRAQKKEQLEVIQVRLSALSDGNNKMEMEILQLRAENELLRAEAALNNKESYVYVKIAVLLGVLGLFSIRTFGSGSEKEESGNWFNTVFLGIIIIILMMK